MSTALRFKVTTGDRTFFVYGRDQNEAVGRLPLTLVYGAKIELAGDCVDGLVREEKFDDPCEDAGGASCGEHRTRLAAAGWREVWTKVYLIEDPARGKERHVLSRGGSMCPACVAKYEKKPASLGRRRRRAA